MKRLNKIFSAILTIVIFGCFAVLISVSISIRKQEVPNLFGYSFLIVETPSMEPTIMTGDMVIVKCKDEYDKGKIITYYTKINNIRVTITHRIDSILDDGSIVTKGDNNDAKDEPISSEDIIGEVVVISPLLGQIFGFATNGSVVFLLIIIVLLIFVGFLVYTIIKSYKEMKKRD